MLLGQCIKHLGDQYSLLGANWYIIVFLIFDIISLVLQAIGGGQASVQAQNYEDTTAATHISTSFPVYTLQSKAHVLIKIQCSAVSSSSL